MFGFTNNGFLRKRFVEFYGEFRTRLESSSGFPSATTLSKPDKYAGTPLVELVSLMSGTLHDIHEVAEAFHQNGDPRDAEGRYLDSLGVLTGLRRQAGELDSTYRARVTSTGASFTRAASGAGIEANVGNVPGVAAARLTRSTWDNVHPEIPAPGAALAVFGDYDYNEVSQTIFDNTPIGVMHWVGDKVGTAYDAGGKCHPIRFVAGCRVMAGIYLHVEIKDCCEYDLNSLPSLVVDRFRASHKYKQTVTLDDIRKLLCDIDCLIVHKVELARRPRQIGIRDEDGDYCNPINVYLDNDTELTTWMTDIICQDCPGEVWCPPKECDLTLAYNEFLDAAEPLVHITVHKGYSQC